MVPPEHRHFAGNAAAMLAEGASRDDVMASMRQLGFTAEQALDLYDLAQRIHLDALMRVHQHVHRRWWEFWK